MVRVFECYAGFGGASFGLKRAGIPYENVGYSEIDKGAIELYDLNHPGVQNFGDITKIDSSKLPDFDLITGGFPCQDVSIAGLRDLSKGRTKTVFKMLEIIRVKKPKYCLLENVKGILSMLKGDLLREIIRQLKCMGYAVSYKVLNSKEHGVPQNRERVWIAAQLGRQSFGFNPFPKKQPLQTFVKDLLEKEVDEKYYLTPMNIDSMNRALLRRGKKLENNLGVQKGVVNCLTTHEPKRALHDATIIVHSKQPRTGDPKKGGTGPLLKSDGTIYCVDTGNSQYIELKNRKRVLTPKECYRHMGFFKDEINLGDLSNNKLYKLAGNGWDSNVVSKIFIEWFK